MHVHQCGLITGVYASSPASIIRGPIKLRQGARPQGGTLIVSCIRRLGSFWGVQKLEFQYFWGFSEKKIFFGYAHFVDIFWGHHKIGLYLGVISMLFKVPS